MKCAIAWFGLDFWSISRVNSGESC